MKKYILLIILLSLMRCEQFSPEDETNKKIVVSGNIYSGQPVSNFTLYREMLMDETSGKPISNATIELVSAKKTIYLEESDSVAGEYNQITDDITFDPGEKVSVFIKYKDEELEAETTIPDTVSGLSVNDDSLMAFVSWNADGNTRWLCHIEINSNFSNDESDGDSTLFMFMDNWEMVENEPFYMIPIIPDVSVLNCKVTVCQPDDFYNYLYNENYFGYHLLEELPSNITNGLGVVAGFGYSTIEFKAYPIGY